jgi:hypothetical protein
MLLTRVLDSPARAFVYEAAGSVDGALLDRGARLVAAFCEHSHIPFKAITEAGPETWADAVDALLA